MYQLIKNPRGDRYTKDGKFVSEKSIPKIWKRILNNQDVITGEPATKKRLIANVMIPLSSDSYYSPKVTVGFLTGLLRRNNGTDEETPERGQAERPLSAQGVSQGQDPA